MSRSEDIQRIDVHDCRVSRHRTGPLDVQVRFRQIAVVDPGVGPVQHQLRIVRGQVELLAKCLNIRHVDVGLADHHEFLAGSRKSCPEKRSDIVNCGHVVRRKEVRIAEIGRCFRGQAHGLQSKIVQAPYTAHHILKRGGNRWSNGVGKMRFPVHLVTVDFSAQRAGYLIRGAAEGDPVTAAGNVVHRQSLRFKPGSELADIAFAQAKSIGKLLGIDPAMVIRRRRFLLFADKLVEFGRRVQQQGQIGKFCRWIELADVIARLRSGVDLPPENESLLRVHGCDDPILRNNGACRQQRGDKNEDIVSAMNRSALRIRRHKIHQSFRNVYYIEHLPRDERYPGTCRAGIC